MKLSARMKLGTWLRPLLVAAAGALVAAVTALVAVPSGSEAQVVPIDRWLVTSAEIEAGTDPFSAPGVERFPDRNLATASGHWSLARDDSAVRFDFSELVEPGEPGLAHAYLKAEVDRTVRLAIESEACARLEVWVNGQQIPARHTPARLAQDIRLASGWNTLLVLFEGESACSRSISAALSAGAGPSDLAGARSRLPIVQASRPPGVQPNFPEGILTVSAPRVTGLVWQSGSRDLEAAVSYELVSWGGGSSLQTEAGRQPNLPGPGRPLVESVFDAPRPRGADVGRGEGAGTELSEGAAGRSADDTGPTDPDGMRASMRLQLLGLPVAKGAAPSDGSVELRFAGFSIVGAANQLQPVVPVTFEGSLAFRKLRDAALRDDGLKASFRWSRGDAKSEGAMPAASVLRALHGPIELRLENDGSGVAHGVLRVPEALAGFALRGVEGTWSIGGTPASDGILCNPCERGSELELQVEGTGDEAPLVQIVGPGLPETLDQDGAQAIGLLAALEGDNRRYRELLRGGRGEQG